jgi:glyoxylase-like metal-dependent hydrolase (beta-lactamase superfamily II)
MRVHHLNAATLCPMSARLVNGTGGWLDRARLVCHVLLLETEHGLVLVDAGLGDGDIADPSRLGSTWLRQVAPKLDPAETAAAQVQALGFAIADVRHIVLTHLDLDHAGGITDFPEATVHVHAREHRAATNGEGTRAKVRYIGEHFRHRTRWALFDDGGERWFDFDGIQPLFDGDPDILLVPLAGHTVGHTGIAVRTPGGWLLHAGDAYFFHGQIATPPRAPLVIRLFQRRSDMDRELREANQERLRRLALEQGSDRGTRASGGSSKGAKPPSNTSEVTVFCSHDPVELDRVAERGAIG